MTASRWNILAHQTGRHLLLLVAVASAIGAYKIATTTLIAGDGATFIRYAQNLPDDPAGVIRSQDQHPGFPAILLAAHRLTAWGPGSDSAMRWIYTSQVTTLLFRIGALVVLYFVGRLIVGPQRAVLAVLILTLLRKPAEHGSDVLSDWPHLFMLAGALLILLHATLKSRWWLFAIVGFTAGLGYLIRPECAQITVCAGLWLIVRMVKPSGAMTRTKAAAAMAVMIVGFALPAAPYMIFKGSPLPKKALVILSSDRQESSSPSMVECSVAGDAAKGLGKLVNRFGDVLMWGFFPGVVLGSVAYFRQRSRSGHGPELLGILVVMNIVMLVWLFCNSGYISNRHELPLVVYTIFHVSAGALIFTRCVDQLRIWVEPPVIWFVRAPGYILKKCLASALAHGPDCIACAIVRVGRGMMAGAHLGSRFLIWMGNRAGPARNQRICIWTGFYLTTCLLVTLPALTFSIRGDKQAYRDAADWIRANSEPDDTIITGRADRIAFYAERPYLLGFRTPYFPRARYVVQELSRGEDLLPYKELSVAKSWSMGKGRKVVLYTINLDNGKP